MLRFQKHKEMNIINEDGERHSHMIEVNKRNKRNQRALAQIKPSNLKEPTHNFSSCTNNIADNVIRYSNVCCFVAKYHFILNTGRQIHQCFLHTRINVKITTKLPFSFMLFTYSFALSLCRHIRQHCFYSSFHIIL